MPSAGGKGMRNAREVRTSDNLDFICTLVMFDLESLSLLAERDLNAFVVTTFSSDRHSSSDL
jgi:hypothetical protein